MQFILIFEVSFSLSLSFWLSLFIPWSRALTLRVTIIIRYVTFDIVLTSYIRCETAVFSMFAWLWKVLKVRVLNEIVDTMESKCEKQILKRLIIFIQFIIESVEMRCFSSLSFKDTKNNILIEKLTENTVWSVWWKRCIVIINEQTRK